MNNIFFNCPQLRTEALVCSHLEKTNTTVYGTWVTARWLTNTFVSKSTLYENIYSTNVEKFQKIRYHSLLRLLFHAIAVTTIVRISYSENVINRLFNLLQWFFLLPGEYPRSGFTTEAPPITSVGPASCIEGWTLYSSTESCYKVSK